MAEATVILTNTPVPFVLDDIYFDKITTGSDGQFEEDARPSPGTLDVTERYEVVQQKVPGFKSITQSPEPEALKVLHFVVQTFTKDDRDFMDGLNNFKPHYVITGLLTKAPLKMYLESKTRRYPRTGTQMFNIEWDVTLVEVRDRPGSVASGVTPSATPNIPAEFMQDPAITDPENWVAF